MKGPMQPRIYVSAHYKLADCLHLVFVKRLDGGQEYVDDVLQLQMVSVRVLDSNITVKTFLSNCDLTEDSDWDHSDEGPDSDASIDSNWGDFANEICDEDLPRLGLVQLTENFDDLPLEWQYADEFWVSNTTSYSHDTSFKGQSTVPLPSWFTEEAELLESFGSG
ncbi:hypothetical protein R1sor_019885 [Riccia sorocarpa]|uniref:Uncharacterized protein n=1 Tax=Riccia sorocarpa TaxID=122646 RepID=A0ABD3IDS5_9MARC